jgi:hypothetical protein
MRLFLGMNELVRHSEIVNTIIDDVSCVSSSVIGSEGTPAGHIRNSVVSNVRCKYIEADNCVLINVTADRIIAKAGSIIYNLIDHEANSEANSSGSISEGGIKHSRSELRLLDKEVRVGVFSDDGSQAVVRSHLDIDGGKVWETKLEGNHASFEDIHGSNKDACPITLERVIATSHDEFWNKL